MGTEMQKATDNTNAVTDPPTGPWDSALDALPEWDPKWAELCFKMSTNPWTHSVLPRKFIELVSISLNAACTNLNPEGTRHHIRAAIETGATREETLFALKCGSALSIHSCSLAAPIVLEEAKAANVQLTPRANPEPTPACDAEDWTVEHSMGPLLRTRSGIHRRIHGHGGGFVQEWSHVAQGGRTPQHRPRRFGHAHVCARHTPPYQKRTKGWRDYGGDHGSAGYCSLLDVAQGMGLRAVKKVRFARGPARTRSWCAVEHRAMDWAARSSLGRSSK